MQTTLEPQNEFVMNRKEHTEWVTGYMARLEKLISIRCSNVH